MVLIVYLIARSFTVTDQVDKSFLIKWTGLANGVRGVGDISGSIWLHGNVIKSHDFFFIDPGDV